MRTAIDDLPYVSASRMRAAGEIRPDDSITVVRFGDLSFTVALQHIRFPNNGGWSFFICACGRRCRTIRLHDGGLACKHCLEAKGLRYRVEDLSRPERAAHVASRLKPRLALRLAGAAQAAFALQQAGASRAVGGGFAAV